MNARQTTRSTCLLLITALVHQLGASPCGCLDHNRWYQSVVALVCVDCPHEHATPEDTLHAADCEHTTPFAALAPTRVGPTRSAGGDLVLIAPPAEILSIAGVVSGSPTAERTTAALGLPVRAQTQVFRL